MRTEQPPELSQAEAVVQVEHVNFSWQDKPVLVDCSLEVGKGVFLGLLGPNGGGKTTLLRLILGELVPYSGRVVTLDTEAHCLGRRRHLIGYVPQRERAELNFPATALDAVVMGTFATLGWGRRTGRTQREQALHTLDRLGLAEVAHQPLRELSGGQQQRVFVARAMVSLPQLLLLDEPTVGMDVAAQELFFERLRALQKERGLTVIMATHDMEHTRHVADWIACISQQIHWHEPSETVTEEALEAACELRAFHDHVRLYHSGDNQGGN